MSKVVTYPNDCLTTPTDQFDFANPQTNPHELVQEMLQVMNESNGIGLSANQIGLPYRVFVMRGNEYNFACFNPRIVSMSEQTNTMEEGCLSFPGLVVKVPRSNSIRLRFQTASGGTDTRTFDGLSARVVQHEMDHLDGNLFYNKAHRYHREKALKRYTNGKTGR